MQHSHEQASDRIIVVTPWYPTPERPYDGGFVADSVRALEAQGVTVQVLHLLNTATQVLGDEETAGVVRLPFSAPAGTSREEMSRRQAASLTAARDVFTSATAVHAHVGIPTGAAVAEVLPPTTRFVVTEHASYLSTELTYPAGRRLYRRILRRAACVLTVSETEAHRIRAVFPERRDRVLALGNPVRTVGRGADRAPRSLDRWLYVGNLIATKGVAKVLSAFALWAQDHPQATLTFAGSGSLADALREQAELAGLAERVHLLGAVRPADLGTVFDDADVLVHLSQRETFGMAVVEAAMSGLPVVVSRCGGPEETLARSAETGVVQFVSLAATPAEVCEAVRRCSNVNTELAQAARAELVAHFGMKPFGKVLLQHLRGNTPGTNGPRLMLIAGSPRGNTRLTQLAAYALRQGCRVTALVSDTAEAATLDPRVDIVDLGRKLRWFPHHLVDTVLLQALPETLFDGAVRVLDAPSRWRGRAARAASRAGVRVQKATSAVRRGPLQKVYGLVDPWLTTVLGAKEMRRLVSEKTPALIMLTDAESRPAARALADLLPEVEISVTSTLEEVARFARTGALTSEPSL